MSDSIVFLHASVVVLSPQLWVTSMRLESFLFGDKNSYVRMADVLSYSASVNCSIPLSIRRVDTSNDPIREINPRLAYYYIDNAIKTRLHRDLINSAKDGELIGLLDSDLMILHDIKEIKKYMWGMDFAYTVRPGQWPFNSGVVFVRVSDKTRNWYDKWLENVKALLANAMLRRRYEDKYGRINQCGLGMLLESNHDLNILRLDCKDWNCVTQTYHKYDPATTKIVHILGKLRDLCVLGGRAGGTPTIKGLVQTWNRLEHQMKIRRDSDAN